MKYALYWLRGRRGSRSSTNEAESDRCELRVVCLVQNSELDSYVLPGALWKVVVKTSSKKISCQPVVSDIIESKRDTRSSDACPGTRRRPVGSISGDGRLRGACQEPCPVPTLLVVGNLARFQQAR